MKSKDKKVLLVGAGAVGLLALAVYASQGAGAEPLNLGGGGGVAGGGMPAVFAGGVDGNGEGTGQAEVTYNVAFPDVQVPAMPSPPNYRSDSGSKKGNRITETVTMSTGQTQEGGYQSFTNGIFEVAAGTTWKGDDAGYTAGATPAGATPAGDVSGIPGGSSTKKGATVGAGTAPGGLPGLVGNLIGGIGGLFGW